MPRIRYNDHFVHKQRPEIFSSTQELSLQLKTEKIPAPKLISVPHADQNKETRAKDKHGRNSTNLYEANSCLERKRRRSDSVQKT